MDSVRIDRWLWSIRLYKTRSLAADACKAGHVALNGAKVKPAAMVKVGDTVEARVGDRLRVVEALALIENRVGAPVAVQCYVDHSPEPEPFDVAKLLEGRRDPGSGRPTKLDRRETERLTGRKKR